MAKDRNTIVIVDDLRQMLLDFEEAGKSFSPALQIETFDNAKDAGKYVRSNVGTMLGVISDFWILKDETDETTGDPRYDPRPFAMDLLRDIPDYIPVILYTRFKTGTFQASTEEYLDEAKASRDSLLGVESYNTDSRSFLKKSKRKFEEYWAYKG